jgi:hypothetical protein
MNRSLADDRLLTCSDDEFWSWVKLHAHDSSIHPDVRNRFYAMLKSGVHATERPGRLAPDIVLEAETIGWDNYIANLKVQDVIKKLE